MRLYEIADEYRRVIESCPDGELDEATLATLDQLDIDFAEKVEAAALVREEKREQIAAMERQIARLTLMAHRQRCDTERLEDYILECLNRAAISGIKTDRIMVRAQVNSRPTVEWTGLPEDIPPSLKRVKTVTTAEFDKSKALAFIEAGGVDDRIKVRLGSHLRFG